MTTRRWITSALMMTMMSALAPVNSWAGGPTPAAADVKTGRLQMAIRQAAASAAMTPSLQLQSKAPAKSTGVRKQSNGGGGGHTGMIIGLVTAAAGIGATVYMVKEMEKTTKNLPTPY